MLRIKTILFTLLLLSSFLTRAAQPILSLENGSNPEQGIIKLHWGYPESDSQEFELQQAISTDFKTFSSVYHGSDRATFISGLADGNYHYRVYHPATETYSEVLSVEVKHHPLSLAFTMLGLGAVVFIFTVVYLIKGRQKSIN